MERWCLPEKCLEKMERCHEKLERCHEKLEKCHEKCRSALDARKLFSECNQHFPPNTLACCFVSGFGVVDLTGALLVTRSDGTELPCVATTWVADSSMVSSEREGEGRRDRVRGRGRGSEREGGRKGERREGERPSEGERRRGNERERWRRKQRLRWRGEGRGWRKKTETEFKTWHERQKGRVEDCCASYMQQVLAVEYCGRVRGGRRMLW